ncbi:MAG TPA: hypothetical protein VGN37_10590 [Actinocatenispora sp.]
MSRPGDGWRPAALPDDRLDAVAAELLDLLGLVDRALRRYGVVPEHEIVAGLREFAALPGAVAAGVVDTDPREPWHAAYELAGRRSAVLAAAGPLARDGDRLAWSGAGRAAYETCWGPLSGQVAEALPATLAATASYGAHLAQWYAALRAALVDFFLRYGTGPAAVGLRTAPIGAGGAGELAAGGTAARAAADLGAACFAALRPVLRAGAALRDDPPARPRHAGPAPSGHGGTAYEVDPG